MINTTNEQANQLALKQRFVDRAKALSDLAEVFRCQQVKRHRAEDSPPGAALNRTCRPARWTPAIKAAGPTN
jgi:hypothetical protein